MANDDMHVIMYKILAYLYDCMKKGEEPQNSMISYDSDLLGIPAAYWNQIMAQMVELGLVKGIAVRYYDNSPTVLISKPYVTLEGVQFMQENSMMSKALKFLKESKAALPFI
ncbi:YjcQ family protein [Eggerthella sp. YY7918]|uniref:YjcQ family protein n=1 Tax=Eggerthella sp. (strain YY7918) TaxID=502558 RepID=UPI00021716CD|nr:YjcQ family protein [Eggerthella sp. YY7918]BAK45564.1 hypothetical protein EGYY_24950 [Eggerthella sp. YY7918]